MTLSPRLFNVGEIEAFALKIVPGSMMNIFPERMKDKHGAWLHIIDERLPYPALLSRECGKIPTDNLGPCRIFAEEKALRLMRHPEHVASRQSRDPEQKRWGGAIRAGHYIYSLSGLPEMLDEAAMIYLCFLAGQLAFSECGPIAHAAGHNAEWQRVENIICTMFDLK